MSKVNHSMSLTPPAELSSIARWGGFMLALGIIAMITVFLGSENTGSVLPLVFGGTAFVAAGVILSRNKKGHNRTIAFALIPVGIISFIAVFQKIAFPPAVFGAVVLGLLVIGGILYTFGAFGQSPAGIKNNGIFHSQVTKNSGIVAWILGIVFTGFYIILYWFPQNLYGLVEITDPIYHAITGRHAIQDGQVVNQWFLYGMIYTLLVLVMGFRFAMKYRHSPYQLLRTLSVTLVQLILAFLLPAFLEAMNAKGNDQVFAHYFSYFWPLDYDALFPDALGTLGQEGGINYAKTVVYWGILMSFVAVPILTYFFGKRWYCSWVCGCGGLAETAGDPYRHLSDKSLKAWQIERYTIHGVLALITVTTIVLLVDWKADFLPEGLASGMKSAYGFVIASTFAGVVGTGFYPIMGSRVWCRFGCPQAAVLGLMQKYFSRFRITTNGSQCISCGNCSTYCEMGIDVKWYAQRGQNIIRASCVGCGICSSVCPRGVLNLENGPKDSRYNDLNPISISRDEIKVNG